MSEDGTNKQASALGYADEERADMIIGAARILRKDVTTRSGSDSLSRLLLVFDKASRFDETMRALVEGDAAHAEIVRGLRAEILAARAAATAFGDDADELRQEAESALRERDEYKKLLAACTEQLLANHVALEEATEVITANSALMLDGRDVVGNASTVLSDSLVNAARYEAKFAEALFERDRARTELAEEQTKCSERIAELAKAHNEVVLSYERQLHELRKDRGA